MKCCDAGVKCFSIHIFYPIQTIIHSQNHERSSSKFPFLFLNTQYNSNRHKIYHINTTNTITIQQQCLYVERGN